MQMLNKNSPAVPPYAQAHKKHVLIVVCICAIIAGLLSTYVYVTEVLDENAESLALLVQERDKEQAHVAYLNAQKEALRSTEAERRHLDTYFMDEKSVAYFLGQVETVGRGIGLRVDTVSLGVSNGILNTEISAAGAFPFLQQFVALVEKMPYKLRIDHADFTRAGDSTWSVRFALKVISFSGIR